MGTNRREFIKKLGMSTAAVAVGTSILKAEMAAGAKTGSKVMLLMPCITAG